MIENIFEIYLIICGILVSLIILAGIVWLLLTLIGEIYGRIVGIDIVRKALKQYINKKQKPTQLDISKAFEKGDK